MIMGVVFKLPRVSIWDTVRGICQWNTSTSFSFGVLSPSGELQTKKVEPINCIIKCNLSTPLGPSLMPLHQWFSYLIDRSDIVDTILNRIFLVSLGVVQFNIVQRKVSRVLLYYATKSIPCQAGLGNLRCGTFSAPHPLDNKIINISRLATSCQVGTRRF